MLLATFEERDYISPSYPGYPAAAAASRARSAHERVTYFSHHDHTPIQIPVPTTAPSNTLTEIPVS